MSIFGTKEEKEPKKERIYTSEELSAFDKELEPYRIEGELSDGRKVRYLAVGGEWAYMRDKGIIESWQKLNLDIKRISLLPAWRIKDRKKYEEHERKMRQYWQWKGKKEFGNERQIEFWDGIAQKENVVINFQ